MRFLKILSRFLLASFLTGVLLVGLFLWSLKHQSDKLEEAVHFFEKEFSAGAPMGRIFDRATELGAKNFILMGEGQDLDTAMTPPPTSADAKAPALRSQETFSKSKFGKTLATAYSDIPVEPSQKHFESDFKNLLEQYSKTTQGLIYFEFPGFMSERWVVEVQYSEGKIDLIESRFLD